MQNFFKLKLFQIQYQSKKFSTKIEKLKSKQYNAAVILSGCGIFDGSDIIESVAFIIALNKYMINAQYFAPNENQFHIVDHYQGDITASNDQRNMIIESARITRGDVQDLKKLQTKNFDLLYIPGGFGVVKNLSDYALQGVDFEIQKDLDKIIKDFSKAKKPITTSGIGSILLAKSLQGQEIRITLGHKNDDKDQWPYSDLIDVAESLGAKHFAAGKKAIVLDKRKNLITTPAFLKQEKIPSLQADIFDQIDKCVKESIKRIKKTK